MTERCHNCGCVLGISNIGMSFSKNKSLVSHICKECLKKAKLPKQISSGLCADASHIATIDATKRILFGPDTLPGCK